MEKNFIGSINMNMKIKKIAKFIFYELTGFIIGYYIFYVLELINKTWMNNSWTIIDFIFYFIIIVIPVAIIHVRIGEILFGNKKDIETLANKMLMCQFRKKYGYDYCTKCPESYTCADIK